MTGRRYRDARRLMSDLRQTIEGGLAKGYREVHQELVANTPRFSGALAASNNISQGMPDLSIAIPEYDDRGDAIPDSVSYPSPWSGEIRLNAGTVYLTNDQPYALSIYLGDHSRKLSSDWYPDFALVQVPQILDRNLSEALAGF